MSNLHHFWDTAIFRSNNANFQYYTCWAGDNDSLHFAVLTQYLSVTDRRLVTAQSVLFIASHSNNDNGDVC